MARGASSLWAGICISIFDASRGWFCSFAGLALELFGRSRCSYAYYKGQKMWAEKACTLKKNQRRFPVTCCTVRKLLPNSWLGAKHHTVLEAASWDGDLGDLCLTLRR